MPDDGNTAVFQITQEFRRGEKRTAESRVIPDGRPRSCSAEDITFSYNSTRVMDAVLLDYLQNNGAELANEFYLEEKKRRDSLWLSFLNSGKGNGHFSFSTFSVGEKISAYFTMALGRIQKETDGEITKVLLMVKVFLKHNRKFCRTPFWLSLDYVNFTEEQGVFDFSGLLLIRNDCGIDYSDFCPWEMRVRGNFDISGEQGEIQVMGYRDHRSR